MVNDAFVDTSGFYALLVQTDDRHVRAKRLLAAAAGQKTQFVTTDYVLDETATLLKSRGHGQLTSPFFDIVLASRACLIEWMSAERFGEVRRSFLQHADKGWSFTDCFSFQVMKQRSITRSLTKDRHFRQAGFEPLL